MSETTNIAWASRPDTPKTGRKWHKSGHSQRTPRHENGHRRRDRLAVGTWVATLSRTRHGGPERPAGDAVLVPYLRPPDKLGPALGHQPAHPEYEQAEVLREHLARQERLASRPRLHPPHWNPIVCPTVATPGSALNTPRVAGLVASSKRMER